MKTVFVNSKKAAVQIFNKRFSGEITEVEKLAEVLGQYGNIVSYKISSSGDDTIVMFDLLENYDDFIKKSNINYQTLQNQNIKSFKDQQGNEFTISDDRTLSDNNGKQTIKVKDPNTGEIAEKILDGTETPVMI
jgi:hypothetical protein